MNKRFKELKKRVEDLIDDVNWEIGMFLKYGSSPGGIFESWLVPAAVAFVTAIITVAKFHGG